MKLSRAGCEIQCDIEELSGHLASGHSHDTALLHEMQSRLLDGGWYGDVPGEVCVELVEGGGSRLLNDDGTVAGRDAVVSLGRRVWDKLVQTAEMGLEEEEMPEDARGWP